MNKRFLVKSESKLLPNNFIIQRTKRNIYVVACHLQVLDDFLKGYTLYSNISRSGKDYIDGFVAFCNEYFDTKKFCYRDVQFYETKVKIKDLDDEVINLNEIVDKTTNQAVDIPVDELDPLLHKFKYKLCLELVLEIFDEQVVLLSH
jgi:hypothetical protein